MSMDNHEINNLKNTLETEAQQNRFELLMNDSHGLLPEQALYLAKLENVEQVEATYLRARKACRDEQINHKKYSEYSTLLHAIQKDFENNTTAFLQSLTELKSSGELNDYKSLALEGGQSVSKPDQLNKLRKTYSSRNSQANKDKISEITRIRKGFETILDYEPHFNALEDLENRTYLKELIEDLEVLPDELAKALVEQKLAAQSFNATRANTEYLFDKLLNAKRRESHTRRLRHVSEFYDEEIAQGWDHKIIMHTPGKEIGYWRVILGGEVNLRKSGSKWREGLVFTSNYSEVMHEKSRQKLMSFYGDREPEEVKKALLIWTTMFSLYDKKQGESAMKLTKIERESILSHLADPNGDIDKAFMEYRSIYKLKPDIFPKRAKWYLDKEIDLEFEDLDAEDVDLDLEEDDIDTEEEVTLQGKKVDLINLMHLRRRVSQYTEKKQRKPTEKKDKDEDKAKTLMISENPRGGERKGIPLADTKSKGGLKKNKGKDEEETKGEWPTKSGKLQEDRAMRFVERREIARDKEAAEQMWQERKREIREDSPLAQHLKNIRSKKDRMEEDGDNLPYLNWGGYPMRKSKEVIDNTPTSIEKKELPNGGIAIIREEAIWEEDPYNFTPLNYHPVDMQMIYSNLDTEKLKKDIDRLIQKEEYIFRSGESSTFREKMGEVFYQRKLGDHDKALAILTSYADNWLTDRYSRLTNKLERRSDLAVVFANLYATIYFSSSDILMQNDSRLEYVREFGRTVSLVNNPLKSSNTSVGDYYANLTGLLNELDNLREFKQAKRNDFFRGFQLPNIYETGWEQLRDEFEFNKKTGELMTRAVDELRFVQLNMRAALAYDNAMPEGTAEQESRGYADYIFSVRSPLQKQNDLAFGKQKSNIIFHMLDSHRTGYKNIILPPDFKDYPERTQEIQKSLENKDGEFTFEDKVTDEFINLQAELYKLEYYYKEHREGVNLDISLDNIKETIVNLQETIEAEVKQLEDPNFERLALRSRLVSSLKLLKTSSGESDNARWEKVKEKTSEALSLVSKNLDRENINNDKLDQYIVDLFEMLSQSGYKPIHDVVRSSREGIAQHNEMVSPKVAKVEEEKFIPKYDFHEVIPGNYVIQGEDYIWGTLPEEDKLPSDIHEFAINLALQPQNLQFESKQLINLLTEQQKLRDANNHSDAYSLLQEFLYKGMHNALNVEEKGQFYYWYLAQFLSTDITSVSRLDGPVISTNLLQDVVNLTYKENSELPETLRRGLELLRDDVYKVFNWHNARVTDLQSGFQLPNIFITEEDDLENRNQRVVEAVEKIRFVKLGDAYELRQGSNEQREIDLDEFRVKQKLLRYMVQQRHDELGYISTDLDTQLDEVIKKLEANGTKRDVNKWIDLKLLKLQTYLFELEHQYNPNQDSSFKSRTDLKFAIADIQSDLRKSVEWAEYTNEHRQVLRSELVTALKFLRYMEGDQNEYDEKLIKDISKSAIEAYRKLQDINSIEMNADSLDLYVLELFRNFESVFQKYIPKK
jgi:hypothetical protein